MKIPNFILKLIGRMVGKKLGLKEGNMTESKKWYLSKGVLTGIVIVLIGAYDLTRTNLAPQIGFALPPIPEWVLTVLGALGIYSRVTADKKIG